MKRRPLGPVLQPRQGLSFNIHHAADKSKMRASLPATLLLSALLAACASKGDIPPSKHISQSGPLKVHPGLLGQPVPPELQQEARASATASTSAAETPIKMDSVGLRTQRSVYFDLNSADIKADYDPALRAHARYLAEHPNARVRIEGNADERGSADYNRRLGLKRAENVRSVMVGSGAAEKQVNIKTLGEARPKLVGHDEASWSENRRADVVYERED
ncbi:MAG: OmpA/MotB [Proteobacteria bacterium]|nr:OmpA/MotB [Pseudomonadota bacterium]